MKKHCICTKLVPLSLMAFTFGQGSFPSMATEDGSQEKKEMSAHHPTLCKVLTKLGFDQHHLESPEALAAASEKGARKVHDTTVAKVRASMEADKQLEVAQQPAPTSSVFGTLGAIAYSPIKLAGYVRNSLPSLPYMSTTPVPSVSTSVASAELLEEDFVLLQAPSTLISSDPIIYDDYQDSSRECPSSKKPWKVVFSFDGGGGRGYIGAKIVERLEGLTNRRVYELADGSIGSSIGGIMHHGYFSTLDGKNPIQDGRSIVTMFETKIGTIFPQRSKYNYFGKFYDSVTDLFYPQYSDVPLNELLQGEFGNLTLANSLIPVTTTAFNPDHDAPFLFSSDLTPTYKIWQAARSSSAAPTFFELFRPDIDGSIVGQPFLGDGGLTYSNPAMLGILEQKRRAPKEFSLETTVLFSIGTGWAPVEDKLPFDAGTLRAARPVINAVINSQIKGTEQAMITLLPWKNNFRLNPQLKEVIPLDNVTPDILRDLNEAAETQYGKLDEFIDHPAIRAKLEAPRRSDAF